MFVCLLASCHAAVVTLKGSDEDFGVDRQNLVPSMETPDFYHQQFV